MKQLSSRHWQSESKAFVCDVVTTDDVTFIATVRFGAQTWTAAQKSQHAAVQRVAEDVGVWLVDFRETSLWLVEQTKPKPRGAPRGQYTHAFGDRIPGTVGIKK